MIGFGSSVMPYWGGGIPDPPVLTAIATDQGDRLGGESVVCTGSGFLSEGVDDVLFGATSASSFVVDNDGQLTAVAPAHAVGSVDITVVNAGGASAAVAYEYWDPIVPIAPTAFFEAGDYAIALGVGTWTARAGLFLAAHTTAYPDDSPAGTPDFVGANNDRLGINAAAQWNALITRAPTNGATIAVSLDVATMTGTANAIISDPSFYGALIFEGTSPKKATFYYYQGSYKSVQVTVPSSGRITLVVRRDITGTPVLNMTVDGTTWVTGDTVGTLSALAAGDVWLGYNQGISLYPLDAAFVALVTAKAAWTDAEVVKFYKWVAARHP